VPALVLLAFVLMAWRLGYFNLRDPRTLSAAADRVSGTPWLGPIFVLVYATLATLAIPVSPLAYGAGAVFGLVRGFAFVWVASVIGAAAGYVTARTIWSEPAHRLLGTYRGRLRELRQGNTFLKVFRLQIIPITPFGAVNYAAAIAKLPFVPFLAGSALGIVPGTIAAVLVGDRLAAGVGGSDRQAFFVGVAVAVALLALSFVPTLVRKRG